MAMISQKMTYQQTEILVWEITETVDELKALLSHFSVYREDFEKLSTEKRQKEFLAARAALNLLLKKNVLVKYDAVGKPFLAAEKTHISITHSKNWLAVIAHPEKSVGIDLECPTQRIEKVHKRFLNEKEQSQFLGEHEKKYWHLAWCAKEALYKIIGNDAVDFSKDIAILPFDLCAERGFFSAKHIKTANTYRLNYFINKNYYLVFCVDDSE